MQSGSRAERGTLPVVDRKEWQESITGANESLREIALVQKFTQRTVNPTGRGLYNSVHRTPSFSLSAAENGTTLNHYTAYRAYEAITSTSYGAI